MFLSESRTLKTRTWRPQRKQGPNDALIYGFRHSLWPFSRSKCKRCLRVLIMPTKATPVEKKARYVTHRPLIPSLISRVRKNRWNGTFSPFSGYWAKPYVNTNVKNMEATFSSFLHLLWIFLSDFSQVFCLSVLRFFSRTALLSPSLVCLGHVANRLFCISLVFFFIARDIRSSL